MMVEALLTCERKEKYALEKMAKTKR